SSASFSPMSDTKTTRPPSASVRSRRNPLPATLYPGVRYHCSSVVPGKDNAIARTSASLDIRGPLPSCSRLLRWGRKISPATRPARRGYLRGCAHYDLGGRCRQMRWCAAEMSCVAPPCLDLTTAQRAECYEAVDAR